jgi:hypothetical protein
MQARASASVYNEEVVATHLQGVKDLVGALEEDGSVQLDVGHVGGGRVEAPNASEGRERLVGAGFWSALRVGCRQWDSGRSEGERDGGKGYLCGCWLMLREVELIVAVAD